MVGVTVRLAICHKLSMFQDMYTILNKKTIIYLKALHQYAIMSSSIHPLVKRRFKMRI
jgi:hypothetical protein